MWRICRTACSSTTLPHDQALFFSAFIYTAVSVRLPPPPRPPSFPWLLLLASSLCEALPALLRFAPVPHLHEAVRLVDESPVPVPTLLSHPRLWHTIGKRELSVNPSVAPYLDGGWGKIKHTRHPSSVYFHTHVACVDYSYPYFKPATTHSRLVCKHSARKVIFSMYGIYEVLCIHVISPPSIDDGRSSQPKVSKHSHPMRFWSGLGLGTWLGLIPFDASSPTTTASAYIDCIKRRNSI